VQTSQTPDSKTADGSKRSKRSNRMLFIVLAVCAAPLIFSYFTYYVIKPQSRTNYGDLIDPRAYPIPELGLKQLDGQAAALQQFAGKWILLQVDQAACAKPCADKLYYMRQLRLTQGKEMDRIERVWLITDDTPIDTALMKQYDGTHLLRVDAKKLAAWLPVQEGTQPVDHLYMIDPLGNLMMRFPKDPDANKIKKDISRLLKASRIG
jgi:hypothetical protein